MYAIQVIARAEMNYHLSYKRWSRAIWEKILDRHLLA